MVRTDIQENGNRLNKRINEVTYIQQELVNNGATPLEALEIIKTAALCELASCVGDDPMGKISFFVNGAVRTHLE